MKPSEIISADARANNLNPQDLLTYVSDAIKNRNGVLIRKNDSVLLLTPIAKNKAEWNLFTQDQDDVVIDSIKYFIDQVKKTDIKSIYGMVDNLEILQMMNNIGIQIQKSDNPKYEWMGRIE